MRQHHGLLDGPLAGPAATLKVASVFSSDLRWAFESRSPSRSAPSARVPWWLWPNLLSLDAVIVAIWWQALFARSFHAPVHHLTSLVLGLTVWLIYTADRVLDCAQIESLPRTARHRFCLDRRRPLIAGMLLATTATVLLLPLLPVRILMCGAALALFVLLYFGMVHFASSSFQRMWPKEYIVGLVFALGAALPTWSTLHSGREAIGLPVLLFAGLCTLNCLAIESRETQPALSTGIIPLALLLLTTSLYGTVMGAPDIRPLFGALSVAILSMAYLQANAHTFTAGVFRVLADAALLTPALIWLVL